MNYSAVRTINEMNYLRNFENSIINYAMLGKLVKQDQNNDSVYNLITEIYKEKQKLCWI
nr:hypothetical protein [Mycoplasmopsis bovis]